MKNNLHAVTDNGFVLKALRFGIDRHQGQSRKFSGLPYITHPLSVSYVLAHYKQSEKLNELLAAAILHDILEDTDTNFEELAEMFSPLVASLVLELTSDKHVIKKIGKLEYLKKKLVGISSYALVIKLADRLDNISDSPTPGTIMDTIELIAHLRAHRVLSETQEKLCDEILHKCAYQQERVKVDEYIPASSMVFAELPC